MMNESEKSDSSIVAEKLANKPEGLGAEPAERREGTKGNTIENPTRRTPSRESVSRGLDRVRERARREKKGRFTALLHHVNVDLLRAAFSWLKRDAAPGIDHVTWREYEQDLETKLAKLHARVHRGAYRALPSRRKFICKEDGRQRPLGIAALEDKILQRSMVEVLNAIYEEEFLGFSYGFRPGRSQHDALDALAFGVTRTKVNWILDCDLRAFFRLGEPRLARPFRRAPFSSHDLRRTVATRLAESLGDAGDKLVRRVLGHSDGSVTAIYNRYGYVKEMRKALEQWANDLTNTPALERAPGPLARPALHKHERLEVGGDPPLIEGGQPMSSASIGAPLERAPGAGDLEQSRRGGCR